MQFYVIHVLQRQYEVDRTNTPHRQKNYQLYNWERSCYVIHRAIIAWHYKRQVHFQSPTHWKNLEEAETGEIRQQLLFSQLNRQFTRGLKHRHNQHTSQRIDTSPWDIDQFGRKSVSAFNLQTMLVSMDIA